MNENRQTAINIYRKVNQPIAERTPAKARGPTIPDDYDSDEPQGPRNISELLQMSTKKNVGVLASRTATNRPKSRTQANAFSR